MELNLLGCVATTDPSRLADINLVVPKSHTLSAIPDAPAPLTVQLRQSSTPADHQVTINGQVYDVCTDIPVELPDYEPAVGAYAPATRLGTLIGDTAQFSTYQEFGSSTGVTGCPEATSNGTAYVLNVDEDHNQEPISPPRTYSWQAVSYTHLTLPTICSV